MVRLENYIQYRFISTILLFSILLFSLLLMGCGITSNNIESNSAFYAQKGSLEWPVQGEVTEPFGEKVNPVYGTQSYNPGILISTSTDVDVKSVFEGEIIAVYTMPEFGRVVTISHGEYTSLYGNLSELYVEKGMKVQEGEVIGVSGTAEEPKGKAVFFAIFHEGAEADPEPWLASENSSRRSSSRNSGGTSGW